MILIICLMEPLTEFDYMACARSITNRAERENSLVAESEGIRQELDRLVIEQRCRAYILDKAETMGYTLKNVMVETQLCGYVWIPAGVVLSGQMDDTARRKLSELIYSELGIAPERQRWTENG